MVHKNRHQNDRFDRWQGWSRSGKRRYVRQSQITGLRGMHSQPIASHRGRGVRHSYGHLSALDAVLQAERKRIKAEANKARSEAAKGNSNASKNSSCSNRTTTVSGEAKTREYTAKASGTNKSEAGRASKDKDKTVSVHKEHRLNSDRPGRTARDKAGHNALLHVTEIRSRLSCGGLVPAGQERAF